MDRKDFDWSQAIRMASARSGRLAYRGKDKSCLAGSRHHQCAQVQSLSRLRREEDGVTIEWDCQWSPSMQLLLDLGTLHVCAGVVLAALLACHLSSTFRPSGLAEGTWCSCEEIEAQFRADPFFLITHVVERSRRS